VNRISNKRNGLAMSALWVLAKETNDRIFDLPKRKRLGAAGFQSIPNATNISKAPSFVGLLTLRSAILEQFASRVHHALRVRRCVQTQYQSDAR
jgi:hypothetical protein